MSEIFIDRHFISQMYTIYARRKRGTWNAFFETMSECNNGLTHIEYKTT